MRPLFPTRTLAVCACAAGVGVGATAALAADDDEAKQPAVKALHPMVAKQLVPPAGRPSKSLQRGYLKLYAKAREAGAKPGRNIVRRGVKEKDGQIRLASAKDVERSIRVLKRMTAPAPAPKAASSSTAGGQTTSTGGGGQTTSTGGGGAPNGQLEAIAACESGGNPNAVGGGGAYGGKYQFSQSTWASVGGSGNPASAPEAEQDKRAAMLLARDGAGHWPTCGR